MKDIKILIENGVNIEKSLEILGDMTTYDDILTEFVDEVNDKINKAKIYKDNCDMLNYAIFVHSIKSGARYLGFEILGEMSYKHEMESKANNYTYVSMHFDELVTEVNKAVNLAKRYLNGEIDDEKTISTKVEEFVSTNNKNYILIADDSDIITTLVSKALSDKYDLLIAKDGEEVIKYINNNESIVCLLLDLNMPNINGYGVLDYFNQNKLFDKIPVSIITGNDTREEIAKAFSYPIVDVLNKPFSEDKILAIVERTIHAKN